MNIYVTPQPTPINDSGVVIVDSVITDMCDRKQFGLKKYGTALCANNGRNALIDAYQETMDLMVYLKQQIIESDTEPTELW